MDDFEKRYNGKPLGKVKKTMDAHQSKILKRNPELKKKIIIPNGEL